MVTLSLLWLPILLSAVFVFIASNILWMALPFWHGRDYGRMTNDSAIQDALTNVGSGQYIVPWVDWKTQTPEQRAERQKKPFAFMYVRNPGTFAFAKAIGVYFLYTLIVAFFVGYVASRTISAGTHYLEVFRIVGAVGFMSFGFRGFPDSIWYGKPWKVTFKEVIDGLIYGCLMAGTFGWLWPK